MIEIDLEKLVGNENIQLFSPDLFYEFLKHKDDLKYFLEITQHNKTRNKKKINILTGNILNEFLIEFIIDNNKKKIYSKIINDSSYIEKHFLENINIDTILISNIKLVITFQGFLNYILDNDDDTFKRTYPLIGEPNKTEYFPESIKLYRIRELDKDIIELIKTRGYKTNNHFYSKFEIPELNIVLRKYFKKTNDKTTIKVENMPIEERDPMLEKYKRIYEFLRLNNKTEGDEWDLKRIINTYQRIKGAPLNKEDSIVIRTLGPNFFNYNGPPDERLIERIYKNASLILDMIK